MTEPDAEEETRVRRAVGAARKAVIAAMARAGIAEAPGTRDARLLRELKRADPDWLDEDQAQALDRLAWKHRRKLPRHLVPRMNPDDPIVRELEGRNG